MARHLAGTFGSMTGSGERVTLELDGTVNPSELLLLVVAWEPLATDENYEGVTGVGAGYWFYKHTHFTVRQRNKNLDAMTREELETYADHLGVEWDESMTDEELKEAIGLYHDFDDVGTVTEGMQLGFAEYYRFSGAPYRGYVFPYPYENGLLIFPAPDLESSGPEFQPSGAAARIQGLWYPEPFDEIVIEFTKRAEYTGTPDELFAVPWCKLLTWKIAEWGGQPRTEGDFSVTPAKRYLGVSKAEPAERAGDTFEDPPGYWDAWEWVNPDAIWTNLNRHSATMGVNFTYIGVGTPDDPFPNLLGISDGGDTYPTPEPIYDEIVPHVLEYGLAGRWGKGFGTDFAWENWPGAIKIGTIDRPYPIDPAGPDTFIEVYYKLLDSPADSVPLTATGTWGAQQVDQMTGTIITYADLAASYSSYGGLAASVSSYASILAQGSPLFRGPGGYGYLDGPDDPPLVGNGIARTGAMLRGATIGVTNVFGGWLPQIYRLKGPGQ